MLTLGLFGLWGPSPLGMDSGTVFTYRVEVIDSESRVLVSTAGHPASDPNWLRPERLTESPNNFLVGIP